MGSNFVVCMKFIHKNQIIYIMVHTLFWIHLQIFDLVKITQYTVLILTSYILIELIKKNSM